MGAPYHTLVLRIGVCGVGQASERVCRRVSTGAGLCGCVFQRRRLCEPAHQGREGRCVVGRGGVAGGEAPASHIVSGPGPSGPILPCLSVPDKWEFSGLKQTQI